MSKYSLRKVGEGKVRNIYEVVGSITPLLMFVVTDRVSVNDRVVGEIPGRGRLLNLISAYWKNMITCCQIIETDSSNENILKELRNCDGFSIVKKAILIPCEIIVRRYLTGSIYKSYLENNRKEGVYLGINLPAGLEEWDRLSKAVITPTTKAPSGEKDKPILFKDVVLAIEEVMKENSDFFGKVHRTPESYAREIFGASLDIFGFANKMLKQKNILLVDTKFEFGFIQNESNGIILALIDEVLTPDSSRFIQKKEYEQLERKIIHLSKQTLRDWIVENPNLPIPDSVKKKVLEEYTNIYKKLVNTPYFF
ncbi:MAG: phosphoribosylaminoimidazolesuccinocarboxamide synthase [Candidatus Paceibacterota bacterium]|nr:phosphoribosylaminoimidazolesuccinocarboxamide synthase [bacterium]